MSIIDNKKKVLNTIGSYTSLTQNDYSRTSTNVISSVNNSDEIIPYMIDTLGVIVGTEAIKTMIGDLFTNFLDSIEPQLKTILKSQFIDYNSNQYVPSYFSDYGITVPIKYIDLKGKYKTDKNSSLGNLLYNNVNDFDNITYNAILNDGISQSYNNLNITFNSNTNDLTFNGDGNTTLIGDWFSDYIDNSILINKTEVISNIMDNIFGTIKNNQDKTDEEVYNELYFEEIIKNLINGDDSFTLTQDTKSNLIDESVNLNNGVVYDDLGCGLISSTLPLSGLTDFISNISGSTDSYYIANQVENLIDETSSDLDSTNENKQTIKDGFFKKIIKILTKILGVVMVSSPQIRMLLAISSGFQNNGVSQIKNGVEDIGNFKTIIKCIIDKCMAIINEFIYKKVISYLMDLIKPVASKLVKEKITLYVDIIKSLSPISL